MLQWGITHSNQRVFDMTQVSPRAFTVEQINPKVFALTHTSARLFALTHTNPKLFALTHTNPRLFEVTEIWTPCETEVQALALGAASYAPSSEITFIIYFWNTGGEGSDDITWELVDDEDNVLDSGSVNTGTVKWRASGSLEVDSVTAPAVYKEIRIRAKGGADEEWFYSSVAYVLPVDLTVTATLPDSDIFWPGTSVPCSVLLTNAGYSGSQTIEWQMIDDEEAVLDSGTQSSGTIGDFANAEVELDDIWSPSGGDILFKIRARIQGSSTWVLSMQCANYLWITPPPNPTPRG